MKVLVIDGQGGGVGKSLVQALKLLMPQQSVLALGTNSAATTAMLRAGADMGATGENAICHQCKTAHLILGVAGILHANAMLGEISPAMAQAVSCSEAQKILIPLERCGLHMVGVTRQPLDVSVREAAEYASALITKAQSSSPSI